MKDHYDPWYVRLPDGRVIKAKSTQSVRHHIEAGHIPKSGMVRRVKNEEWTALGWTNEFADLVNGGKRPATPEAPAPGEDTQTEVVRFLSGQSADPMELETVGLRGLVEELYSAFDCAVHRDKMLLGGLLCGLAFALAATLSLLYSHVHIEALHTYAPLAVSALILSVGAAWISRQTHWELSRMRPVTLAEARANSLGAWIQSLFSLGIVFGAIGGLLYALNHLRFWLGVDPSSAVGSSLALAILIAKALLYQMAILGLLLVPIGPVEDYGFLESIRVWRKLCLAHIGRILAYESFALVLGFIAAMPLLLPLYLAGFSPVAAAVPTGVWHPSLIYRLGQELVFGFAVGPFFVFTVVANVILYLKLRYEFSANR